MLPLRELPPQPSRIYDEVMSFSDTIFLFFLALVLFGPKKLPEMARQAGKLLAELRRASNEFRSQIETEISHLEVQKNEAQKNEAQKDQTALPPGQPPPGTLAATSLNPAPAESTPPTSELPATPVAESNALLNSASNTPSNSASNSATEPIAEAGAPTSQASHV